MRLIPFALLVVTAVFSAGATAQRPAAGAARSEDGVRLIPQTTPSAPWSFIGFGITAPRGAHWFVADGTPRGATLGQYLPASDTNTAVLVISSEVLDAPIESDAALLELARSRHGRIGDRWDVQKHEETVVRQAGTRCARHQIVAREQEIKSPRKDSAQLNARRTTLFVSGLSCIHPTDPVSLIEIGVSERSRAAAMNALVEADANGVMASLTFHRYSEQALRSSAEKARTQGLADAENVLRPFVEANAAWAGYFLAQIVERASPPPENAGERQRVLLEPAAERGLADAQWMLARLYLRGAPGVAKDPARAEKLLRRAAEHGHPAAAFQLGLSLLTGTDGLAANSREAAQWIQRAAFRGQKEAQQMIADAKVESGSPLMQSPVKGTAKR